MKTPFVLVLAICAAIGSTATLADDAPDAANASVLVNLVPLKKGSLPVSITTYGRFMPAEKSRETISAPIAAQVSNINVHVGEEVDKGTQMITLTPGPESRAAYKQARQAVLTANHLLERSRSLANAHLETAAQLALDEKTAADANSTLEALQEQGANGANTLKAPFKAIVMSVGVSSGAVVAPGASLIELANSKGLVFKTGVVPAQAAQIKKGDAVTVTLFSGSGTFHGRVALRGSAVSLQNGLIPVDVAITDGDPLAGEMAKAVINTGEQHGYVVPHAAILLNDSGQTYVVQSVKMVAKKVPVTVIGSQGETDVVSGQLVAGAPVVGAGNYQLDDGDKMRITNSTTSPSGAKGGK
ncbi:MAG: HlyD family efflux transporter periplasmic adaptor subunit [Rhodoferax sp.]